MLSAWQSNVLLLLMLLTYAAAPVPPAGVINITLSYSGPAGAFCFGETFADVLAQGAGCKAEVSNALTCY